MTSLLHPSTNLRNLKLLIKRHLHTLYCFHTLRISQNLSDSLNLHFYVLNIKTTFQFSLNKMDFILYIHQLLKGLLNGLLKIGGKMVDGPLEPK